MSDREEYIQEYYETLDYEANTPLLCGYVDTFLRNRKEIENQEDSRVLFYRGQSDKMFLLTPSVFRNGWLPKEHTLIYDLLLNSPDEFSGIENPLERLIKMQHYNLPTRLLDVTTNPLVALYFACNENDGKDGEVIVFYDYMQRHTTIDARCLIALTEYNGSSERQMLGFLSEKGFDKPELVNLTRITHIPIEAPQNNERIKRQHGAFVIVGVHGESDGNPYQKTTFDLKPLLVRNFDDNVSRSIVIPKEEKAQLLKELDTLGINRAFLFPELEHQAAYIRTKYEEVLSP
ncbi:MAG: FRG domain-containing protein [Oscillospiraceae bacterium]|nr:FRG domain-containing protein [Oscillospiraceae bacterium]